MAEPIQGFNHLSDPRGWSSRCGDVRGAGDPFCFAASCANHSSPRKWHWSMETTWERVADWLHTLPLSWQNGRHKFTEIVGDVVLVVQLHINMHTGADALLRCEQTQRDGTEAVEYLSAHFQPSENGIYSFLGRNCTVWATREPGMSPSSTGNVEQVAGHLVGESFNGAPPAGRRANTW